MDRSEEEMKFVGFFGIFKESFKIIFSWRKIFAQITLTFILPLTIIFLAHLEISHRLFWKISENPWPLGSDDSRRPTLTDWLYYWLFKIAYFVILTVFSLLSTAAVVFTIASVYTRRDVTFRKVLKVVPKVWKRLLVTFLYIFLALFIYNTVSGFVFFIIKIIFGYSIIGVILGLILLVLFVLGFLYLSVVWQLASVVTVLENAHGLKAMRKGRDLVKGKKAVGMGIAFVLYGVLLVLIIAYDLLVEYGDETFGIALVWRVMMGMLCGILLLMVFLVFMVTQTMLYLVCKSHHREAIDKLSLSTYLGAYLGETVMYPKVGEEIQLGRPQPQQV